MMSEHTPFLHNKTIRIQGKLQASLHALTAIWPASRLTSDFRMRCFLTQSSKPTLTSLANTRRGDSPLPAVKRGRLMLVPLRLCQRVGSLHPRTGCQNQSKKEMKGLSWTVYSKEHPEIVVAGPVPGNKYSRMTLPVLAPDPSTDKLNPFGKYTFFYGGNRGRGQVYPEGNNSNNNQFSANATGTVAAIDGLKVTIQKADGSSSVVECGAGADIVVEVGEVVKNGEPITTNPNVGGFGQEEKELVLQDMNRVYAYCAIGTSIFFAQLAFVLKKKQFEKVQLAEGF